MVSGACASCVSVSNNHGKNRVLSQDYIPPIGIIQFIHTSVGQGEETLYHFMSFMLSRGL